MFTTVAMMNAISAANRIGPSFVRSVFVVAPISASVPNIADVTRNVVKIDCAV